MKSKKRVSIERRVFSHLKDPLLVRFRFTSPWNNPKATKTIKGKAWDISRIGLCLETEIAMRDGVSEFSETEAKEKVKVLPYLVLSDKEMKVELKLRPNRKRIVVTGKSIWYELALEGSISRLKIGVLFTDMPGEARDTWVQFIKHENSPLPF